jgi:tetratricopeptide (TPR) repeat protein
LKNDPVQATKTRNMKTLFELIRSLTSSEWQSLEKFLTCFSSNREPSAKSWKLAQLLRQSNREPSSLCCSRKIYFGGINEESIERLARNLKYKILDCLISGTHSNADENQQDRETAITKLKRKCLQYHYLTHNKKDLQATRDLLDEIIRMATDYEAYTELVQHLKLKNWVEGLNHGEELFLEREKEIHKYEMINNAYAASYNYIMRLKILYNWSGTPKEEKIRDLLEQAIPVVKGYYADTHSPIIHYYLKTLEMDHALLTKNYLGARSICLDQLDLVKKSRSVFTLERVGIVFNHLEICEMHLGRFDQALEHAQHAKEFFLQKNYNQLITAEWEFYALFYEKKYYEAEICAGEITREDHKDTIGDFRNEKFYLLLACSLFMQNKFKDTCKALQNKPEIKEDKCGWEFSRRLLQIMNHVELGQEDLATKQTDNFKKFIANNKKNHSFSPRQLMIEKFLSHAAHKSFDFDDLNKSAHRLLETLGSADNNSDWQLLSSELIPFHKWAEGKIKDKVLTGGGDK